MYNLLDGWPHGCTVLLPENDTIPSEGNLIAHVIRYYDGPWQPLRNRLGRYLNEWLQRLRMEWLQKNGLKGVLAQLPGEARCLVLVSTTVPEKIMAALCLQQRGYRVIPYFMDDWMCESALQWKHGNLFATIHELLHHAPAWMMISRQLLETLRHRYKLLSKPCLIVHNPSPVVESAVGRLQEAEGMNNDSACKLKTANRRLIYAGSIWPMHAHALIAVARAIHALHAKGESGYEMHIFTSHSHWQQHRSWLQGEGVLYAGWKPYAEIHALLANAWLLVCTASFDEAHAAYSASSVQTKLTDYMAAGRPVLFVGPEGAASGQFVEEYDVGFTLATGNPEDIAERLVAISCMPAQYERKCENALREAATTFSKPAVQKRLYAFLDKVSKE